jgi:gliding motility-associated-like protein
MKKKIILAAVLHLLTIGSYLHAQSFSQNVVGSSGTFATSANGSMAWTIGEVMIETYSGTGNFFTQGFHQPNSVPIPGEVIDFFIPQGFSPNGDGINDLVVITGIFNYPNNSIEIFNRWGDKVFDASPYKNTWDGRSAYGLRIGGNELPVGTYFYILNLGNGHSIYKGTFYLNR